MTNSTSSNTGHSRRDFLKKTATVSAVIAGGNLFTFVEKSLGNTTESDETTPWYRGLTRWGQTNITEKDSINYDIDWWRGYWDRTQTQGIVVNAGGIVAYYPSEIPFHRQAQFLEGRDLFGDLCNAAHADGLAVFARMDSNRAHEEFYNAHPDWFALNANGEPYRAEALYVTCVNSPYYDEYIPDILREIIHLYHPEGFTDNMWQGLNRNSICYCERCSRSFYDRTRHKIPLTSNWDDQVYREWIRWNYDRRLEIWDYYNKTTKSAGGETCIWVGMTSGSISSSSNSFRDYKGISERAEMIMLDHQARYGNANGIQDNAEIGKLVHGLLGWDKLIPESMAMYQQGSPNFRLMSKPIPEARMWAFSGFAGGIQPWWHHVAAYHEDRRMYKTVEPIYRWHKKYEEFLINRQPVASVGVVWSQENMDFYGRNKRGQLVDAPWRGITQALMRSRIPYLPVHADHIERDASLFSVLVLPNLGLMAESQVEAVKRFVERGGGIVATGQSSLFDEWGEPRSDYTLGNLFGAHINTPYKNHEEATNFTSGGTKHTYLRILPELRSQVDGPSTGEEPPVRSERHRVLEGFDETDILPFGGTLRAIRTDTEVVVPLTFIPEFPRFPPEMAWMREPQTDIPGLVLNTTFQGSRVAFLPADLDRQLAQNNLPDHSKLLENLIRWASKDEIPLVVEGTGLVD